MENGIIWVVTGLLIKDLSCVRNLNQSVYFTGDGKYRDELDYARKPCFSCPWICSQFSHWLSQAINGVCVDQKVV